MIRLPGAGPGLALWLVACGQPPVAADSDPDLDPIENADTDDDPSTPDSDPPAPDSGDPGPASACPDSMVAIDAFCIDAYEARLADHSPYEVPVGAQVAVTGPDEVPQAYLSGEMAAAACSEGGKRLCTRDEWERACGGPDGTVYPYGDSYRPDACNDTRAEHPVVELFGADADWGFAQMNDPRLNQLPDGLAPGGAHPDCVTAEGIFDMHGNLHEWVADADGTFKGGFYVDAVINGPGCTYTTTAHGLGYHDYSTGFRCCSDP